MVLGSFPMNYGLSQIATGVPVADAFNGRHVIVPPRKCDPFTNGTRKKKMATKQISFINKGMSSFRSG